MEPDVLAWPPELRQLQAVSRMLQRCTLRRAVNHLSERRILSIVVIVSDSKSESARGKKASLSSSTADFSTDVVAWLGCMSCHREAAVMTVCA